MSRLSQALRDNGIAEAIAQHAHDAGMTITQFIRWQIDNIERDGPLQPHEFRAARRARISPRTVRRALLNIYRSIVAEMERAT